ncbi:MAG: hypothetical protein ABIJ09_10280 [Pseudomonadota bacterium]
MVTTTLLTSALILAAAAAEPASAKPDKIKVAVMKFTAPNFKDDAVENLYGLFVSEFDSFSNLQVVSRDEIEAMLGFEAQKSKLGCDDTSCLAEIAGALGVHKIISGKIGKVGSTFVLNMTMIDHATARVEKRWSKTVKGEDDVLIEAIRQAAREMAVYAAGGTASEALAAGTPEPASVATSTTATTSPGTAASPAADTSSPEGELPILPIAMLGVGGAGVLVAAALGAVSGMQYSAYGQADSGQEARDLHGQVLGLGVGAGVVAGLGVLVAAAGGALLAL